MRYSITTVRSRQVFPLAEEGTTMSLRLPWHIATPGARRWLKGQRSWGCFVGAGIASGLGTLKEVHHDNCPCRDLLRCCLVGVGK